MIHPRTLLRFASHAAFFLVVSCVTAWSVLALYVQLSGSLRVFAIAGVIMMGLAAFTLRFKSRSYGWITLALVVLLIGYWYQTIKPSADRDWAADVAHGVTATQLGEIVTLSNVRNFRWRDKDTADEAWETRSYDLSKLSSVDMVTSVWDNPDFAHLLVSFGFDDGQHVVFSVEIRRQAGEKFSELGGFFRQFELILIAADEADIIKLRTNYRKEDVHLYALDISQAMKRDMFFSYIDLGNRIASEPVFYNTITANCTSTVFKLARALDPNLPIDIRLLMSGHLPEYLNDLGALKGNLPMSERRSAAAISDIAQNSPTSVNFSEAIRATR